MYIHLQKRKMQLKIKHNIDYYKIIPNSFENIEFEKVLFENFDKIKKKNFNLHYFRLRIKNLKIKFLDLLEKKL